MDEERHGRLRAASGAAASLAMLAALVLAAWAACEAMGGWLSLGVHLRGNGLIAAGVSLVLAAWLRRWPTAGLAAGVMILQLYGMWPHVAPVGPLDHGASLRVMHLNLQMDSGSVDEVARQITDGAPDLVALVEANQRWVDGLEPHLGAYAHRKLAARPDFLGLALYSRWPLRSAEIMQLAPWSVPFLVAEVEVDGRIVTFFSLHLLPPIRAEWVTDQRVVLEEVARQAAGAGPATVVCGDFNTTPWTDVFRSFLATSGLRPLRGPWDPGGTWPAWLPLGRIPIDHCLVGSAFGAGTVRVGPPTGGDHLLLQADLDLGP